MLQPSLIAYQLPLHKTRVDIPPCNRPGLPPVILTWVDAESLKAFTDDVAALKAKCDFVVTSCHWGLHQDVLDYMPQIAHAAIYAGADVVIGHGPHYSLPVEAYKGRPIYYGLGSFSFHIGHFGGVAVGDWVGQGCRCRARSMRKGHPVRWPLLSGLPAKLPANVLQCGMICPHRPNTRCLRAGARPSVQP